MSDLISYHLEDGIATLTLSNGKVNAISPDVITAFNAALDQAEEDRAVVIITGQPGILSAGYDLKVMTASPEQAIELVDRARPWLAAYWRIPSRSLLPARAMRWPKAHLCCCRLITGSASKARSALA